MRFGGPCAGFQYCVHEVSICLTMGSLFKAWEANCGILVKLVPPSLQSDLATALVIHTINIYDLLEKYAWEGVMAYQF